MVTGSAGELGSDDHARTTNTWIVINRPSTNGIFKLLSNTAYQRVKILAQFTNIYNYISFALSLTFPTFRSIPLHPITLHPRHYITWEYITLIYAHTLIQRYGIRVLGTLAQSPTALWSVEAGTFSFCRSRNWHPFDPEGASSGGMHTPRFQPLMFKLLPEFFSSKNWMVIAY